MKISEMITDRYKLRIPPTVYYDLLADVREVEEEQEPRKGHWIFDGDCLICSKCKKAYSFTGSNFCPNCGADMR